jgi:putative phage-type endonuclease
MSAEPAVHFDLEQGSPQWHALRKTKITATDSCIIMGASHWRTKIQLYHEKISQECNTFMNERMQRGVDLEPIARDLFIMKMGVIVSPQVVIKDWAMASLDGISDDGHLVVEIKCPGPTQHQMAVDGKVPDYYYPQLQHQMYVTGVNSVHYFSFDGTDGVVVVVNRDDAYIEKMIDEELKFFKCLQEKTPPPPDENDYIERDDDIWEQCASKWRSVTNSIKELEKEEEELRKQLVFLSGESNVKGAGISLCQVQRKGNVDYSKVPQLKGVDLEPFRKASINSWRITCA